jgi:hypothetical protein
LWLEPFDLFDGFVQRAGRLVLRSAGDGRDGGRKAGLLLPRLAVLLPGFAVLCGCDRAIGRAGLLLSGFAVLLSRLAVLRRFVLPGRRLLPGRPVLRCSHEMLRLEEVAGSDVNRGGRSI